MRAPEWVTVTERTERLAVPGGWLYSQYRGAGALAVAFVPSSEAHDALTTRVAALESENQTLGAQVHEYRAALLELQATVVGLTGKVAMLEDAAKAAAEARRVAPFNGRYR